MELFSKNHEIIIREKIRSGFDDSVKDAIKDSDINDPFLGMFVQAAIGSFYQSMKDEQTLKLVSDKLGVDFDSVLEEECQRALKKY